MTGSIGATAWSAGTAADAKKTTGAAEYHLKDKQLLPEPLV